MTGFAPVPVAAGDVVQLNASAAGQGRHAVAAGMVNGTLLAIGFTMTRLAQWIVSSADGSGTITQSCSFASPPLVTEGVVPPNATLVPYRTPSSPTSGPAAMRSAVASANGTDILAAWLQANDGRSGVRWTTVGVPASLGDTWPASKCGALTAMHTSLQTDRLYNCGVEAGGDPRAAVANVTFRVPGPAVELGTDDGNGRTATGPAFSSGALTVPPGASGFLRAVELRSDTPPGTRVPHRASQWAQRGRAHGRLPSEVGVGE